MADPLTVDEVRRYARSALSTLELCVLPKETPPHVRSAIRRARGDLSELLIVCEFVDAVADGIAVVVDPERERS